MFGRDMETSTRLFCRLKLLRFIHLLFWGLYNLTFLRLRQFLNSLILLNKYFVEIHLKMARWRVIFKIFAAVM